MARAGSAGEAGAATAPRRAARAPHRRPEKTLTTDPKTVDIVVLSGLSGSGKTTALHALEDAGYFCVDNLPAPLLPPFLRLVDASPSIQRVAIAMDVRERVLAPDIERDLAGVGGGSHHHLHVLFLTADDDALIARFKTTRRRHPLIAQGLATVLTEAIALERTWLAPLRARATEVLDTTRLNVHDLKHDIQARYGDPVHRRLDLHLVSFGYRHGVPQEADFVFDARFLDNPYFVDGLRDKTGLDPDVADYVLSQPAAARYREHILGLLTDVLPLIEAEGRATLTVAIGCTGGQHRSVALCEALREGLTGSERDLHVVHRDAARW